jgi:hypothetical protein
MRLGGTARVREQAGVVRLRRGLAVDPEPLGEPHRDQRLVQPVLEGKAHAEVSRQAERADHLSGTDLLAAPRIQASHVSTLTDAQDPT